MANQDKKPGFFLNAANWLLSRFPLTKNSYQNWTSGRRILIGWLLWFVCLPIIPLVIIAVWYLNDPESFKKSPIAKGLIGLTIAWAVGFGFIATSPAQLDQVNKQTPASTKSTTETSKDRSVDEKSKVADDKDEVDETKSTSTSNSSQNSKKDSSSSPDDNGSSNDDNSGDDYYENCTDAKNAGVTNIKRSDPGYRSELDRDDDGIACEN